jgi:hypothetical protein
MLVDFIAGMHMETPATNQYEVLTPKIPVRSCTPFFATHKFDMVSLTEILPERLDSTMLPE